MNTHKPTSLKMQNIKRYYTVRTGIFQKEIVKAVDGVSLEINPGDIYAIVGESGSGKSTLARLMVGLEDPDEGIIYYHGSNRSKLRKNKEKWKQFRKDVQMVFQNPYSSLNPKKNIRYILSKPFKVHGINYNENTLEELLTRVDLTPPSSFLNKYPHELSGGQRQRISIARALALNPKVIFLDEPTSELDVTTKVQILDLLKTLQAEEMMALVFITHELPFLRSFALEGIVFVMYNGLIIEEGTTSEIFNNPYHPYTRGLLDSILEIDPKEARKKDVVSMEGEVPSPVNPPPGCRFHPRCSLVIPSCKVDVPPMIEVEGSEYHKVACPVVLDN